MHPNACKFSGFGMSPFLIYIYFLIKACFAGCHVTSINILDTNALQGNVFLCPLFCLWIQRLGVVHLFRTHGGRGRVKTPYAFPISLMLKSREKRRFSQFVCVINGLAILRAVPFLLWIIASVHAKGVGRGIPPLRMKIPPKCLAG